MDPTATQTSDEAEAPVQQASYLNRVRHKTALALYATAGLIPLVALTSSLTGGWALHFAGLGVSVRSWEVLRAAARVLLVGVVVDPRRGESWQRARAAFETHRRALLGCALVLAALYLAAFKVCQHLSFRTGAYDLSMYQYAIRNTLHGHFMHAFGIDRNFFSEHFSPLLLALVPLYALAPSPLTLLVAQSVAVALACVPLYGLARRHLPPAAATVVPAVFLSNAFLWRAFVFDFHVELFAPVTVFLAAWAMGRKRWGWFYAACVLSLCVKEDMAVVVLVLAALLLWEDRACWPHALASALLAIGWGILAFTVVIPHSFPGGVHPNHFLARYSHLGPSYAGVAAWLFTHPGFVLHRLFSRPVRQLVMSMGLLPLLNPIGLVGGVASLGVHLVSNYGAQYRLDDYYGLNGLILMMVTVPGAAARLGRWTRREFAAVALVCAIAASAKAPFLERPTGRDFEGARLLSALPEDARYSAQTSIVPHLAPSPSVQLFPSRKGAEWILLDVDRLKWPLTPKRYFPLVREILGGGRFGVVTWKDGFLFLRRGADTRRNAEVSRALSSEHAARGAE